MRTPKILTKRALGLVLATALAVSGTVALAGSSEAAVATVKLSPKTGGATGGTVVTIAGKNFQNAAGASQVGAIYFSSVVCDVSNKATNAAGSINVISATKISITTPALALSASPAPEAWYVCVDDASDANVIGTAKFSSYLEPTINDQTPATKGLSVLTGASYGGGTLVIQGENFTRKTTATIGGLKLLKTKVVIGTGTTATATGGDDTLTGVIPAGTGTGQTVSITTEGGTVNALIATQLFDYAEAIKVAPAYGDGTVGNVIEVVGSGFLSKTFSATNAANTTIVVLNKPATPLVAGTTVIANASPAGSFLCTAIQVENDSTLSCKLPAIALATVAGPYMVQVVDLGATTISAYTAVSRSAAYTVSSF